MGVIRTGANGGFSGKAGSVIGSSWKSIDYIKGLYKKRTKPATLEQLTQQARFFTVAKFLMPIAPIIGIGYGQKRADRMTAMNVAVQQNLKEALTGSYPNFELDYSNVKIAVGSYIGGGATSVSFDQGLLSVAWSTELNVIYNSQPDDLVFILMYQPVADEFMTSPQTPIRADGDIVIEVPAHLLGESAHVWLFLSDRKMTKISRSSYLGEVVLS